MTQSRSKTNIDNITHCCCCCQDFFLLHASVSASFFFIINTVFFFWKQRRPTELPPSIQYWPFIRRVVAIASYLATRSSVGTRVGLCVRLFLRVETLSQNQINMFYGIPSTTASMAAASAVRAVSDKEISDEHEWIQPAANIGRRKPKSQEETLHKISVALLSAKRRTGPSGKRRDESIRVVKYNLSFLPVQ